MLSSPFRHYIESQLARVLTQMDRDPDSPTFGCFDRNYWHYKIRDFPSSILQQGLFTLEAVRRGDLAYPLDGGTLDRWCQGAVQAFCRQIDSRGGVDEYYPFEHSFPAAAFGLYAIAHTLYHWHSSAPHLLAAVDWEPLRRLASHLVQRVEQEAVNQQAAGLAALALASQLEPLSAATRGMGAIADRLFQSQHPEGWFNEYGGPDFGYLTVTLDALADYHDATGDDRALAAADRAITFLAQLVGADGCLPSTLNCRNTDYVVPYGLVRFAAHNPLASWLVHTLFQTIDRPSHFLWATDDRYHCHYVYASVVRSLPHLEAMLPPQPPTIQPNLWLEGCGYWVVWSSDRTWTAYVAARKGGLVRIHQAMKPPVVDYGWRIQSEKNLFTSNWWSAQWTVDKQGNSLAIRGQCQNTRFHVPTPVKHAILRLLAWSLGAKIIPALKKRMIFRPEDGNGPRFERTVTVHGDKVVLSDRLGAWNGAIARPGPRQNLRHVASADSFSREEWRSPLLPLGDYALTQDVQIQTFWTAERAE